MGVRGEGGIGKRYDGQLVHKFVSVCVPVHVSALSTRLCLYIPTRLLTGRPAAVLESLLTESSWDLLGIFIH